MGDYKVFDERTIQGVRAAERHQQSLYDKYNTVKVQPLGLDRVAVWGESPTKEGMVSIGVKRFKPFYKQYTVASLTEAIKAILVVQPHLDANTVQHYMIPRSAGGLGYGQVPHRMATEQCSSCPKKAMKGAYLCRKHRLEAGWVPKKKAPRLSR